MKKVLGSGWMRAILCIGLYVGWFFLIRYLSSGALGTGMDNLNKANVAILFVFFICSCIAGWRFVKGMNTAAGGFMVVIKVLLACFLGAFVLPFVVGSIPYKCCHKPAEATEE